LLFSGSHEGTEGKVGAILITLLSLTSKIQFGMRMSAEVENIMTSVERMLEYGELQGENDLKSNCKQAEIITNCEEKGEIKCRNVWLKYAAEEPYVLKDINFSIGASEKVINHT
jgi:ATP-binding cassette subfamily C (CFTR/MRP) protein 4